MYQLGSLRERSPLPKKPRRQRIKTSSDLVTQIERVYGSNTPSQWGLSMRVRERPRKARMDWMREGGGCERRTGRGCAYMRAASALRPPDFPLGREFEEGVIRDIGVGDGIISFEVKDL